MSEWVSGWVSIWKFSIYRFQKGNAMLGVRTLRRKLKGTHVIQCSMLSPLRGMGYNGLLEVYNCDCDLHFITAAMQNNAIWLTVQGSTSLIPKLTTWHNPKPVLSTSNSHKLSSYHHNTLSTRFPTKILYTFLVYPYEQFQGHLYLLDFIIFIILGDLCNSRNFSLQAAISLHLRNPSGPNVLQALSSQTL
jgi:hypothetical protein